MLRSPSSRTIAALLLAWVGGATSIAAQTARVQQAADSLFRARQWSAAAARYRTVTAAEPTNGSAWTNLGESLLQLKLYEDARAAFAKSEGLRFRPFVNVVNQARVAAEQRKDSAVFAHLRRIVDAGMGGALRPVITGSTEFNRLGSDPRWTQLLADTRPCGAAAYRQFDFWVGDWTVHAGGQVAGHNVVTLEQDGCLLVEHWTSAPAGQTGTSFNYYDVRDKKWHQLYIDNSGNAGAFPAMAGLFENGRMVLLTDDVNNTLSRWTWYVMAPGKVKQMAELSEDHGQTWATTWDSDYVRVAPPE